MITMAKPVWPQIRITISRSVLSGSPVSHEMGAMPNPDRIAFSNPTWGWPAGW